MRLKKKQRMALLQWLADGLESDEIAILAADFSPPFAVSRATLTHYRKTRAVNIRAILQEDENNALSTGLARKEERVKRLKALALRLERDLFGNSDEDYVWTDQIKSIGSGDRQEIIEYEEFNKAEIDAYRGLLDDLAKEVGERTAKHDITSGGLPITISNIEAIRPDGEAGE